MIKQQNILNKLKAGLITLSVLCFASFAVLSEAKAITLDSITQGKYSVVQREQPNESQGSLAMKREVRVAKASWDKAVEQGSASPLLKYASSLVGDGLSAVFDAGIGVFDKTEKAMPEGFIKDALIKYNPGYKILKFLTKTSLKIGKSITKTVFGESNRTCNKDRMDQIYKSSCYSCVVVRALIGSFMNACSRLYDVSRDAGRIILIVGLMIWLPFYVLQQISSMKNIEPTAMVNDLLIMAFKIIGAYIVIGAGISFFIDFVVVPILSWGADYGTMIIAGTDAGTGLDIMGTEVDEKYILTEQDTGILPPSFLNTILTYVAAVDSTTSTHMQIGHMLTCHSTHAGAVRLIGDFIGTITNIWIWIVGALIWFAGFMMTLSVAFYLIDISFKLGFSIIALPIVVGLWPYNVTKDRLGKIVKIILKSAGIFVFLAMTTAAGLALVSNALDVGSKADNVMNIDGEDQNEQLEELSGTQKIFEAVELGDTDYIGNRFSIAGPSFLIILFAYLYAIKLIGSTVSDYVNTFFPDGVFGDASPMHHKLTQAMAYTKKKVTKGAKFLGRAGKNMGRQALGMSIKKYDDKDKKNLLERAMNFKDGVDKLTDGDLNPKKKEQKKSTFESTLDQAKLKGSDADSRESADNRTSGGDAKNSGQATNQAAKAVNKAAEQASNGMERGADALDKAGTKTMQGGQKMIGKGAALSGTGIGAIAGVPLMIAGAAVVAGGAAAKGGAVGMKAGAKAVKAAGKAAEKTIKAVGKAANKTKDTIKKVKKKVDKAKDKVNKKLGRNQNQSQSNNTNNNDDNKKNKRKRKRKGSGVGGLVDDLDLMNEKNVSSGDDDGLSDTMAENSKKK